MKANGILSLLLVLSLQIGLPADAQISENEFVRQMQAHRWRVTALALAALDIHPETFSALDAALIEDYMRFHDLPKIMTAKELQELGYEGQETLAHRLSQYYGVNRDDLPEDQRAELQRLVDVLNQVESRAKAQFLLTRKISGLAVRQLTNLEHWADVTDTGIARRTELNLQIEPFDGAHYLLSRNQFQGARISESLERNYKSILCRAVFSN